MEKKCEWLTQKAKTVKVMILDFAIMAEAAYMRGIPNLVSTKKKSFETICDHKWQEHGLREKKCFLVDLF